jgi:Tfp pilus assembly protein PilZ
MATQVHPRIAKRMPCSVGRGEQRHKGLVLNVSQGGLFVQTNAALPAGERIALSLTPPGGGSAIPVQARVVWKRVVPHELRTSAQGGLGLRIEQADESFFQHLAEWMRVELGVCSDARLAGPGERPDYYVRVLADGTRRSRRMGIMAQASEAAEKAALAAAGEGWRVLEVKGASEA